MTPIQRSAWQGYLLVINDLIPAVSRDQVVEPVISRHFAALHAHLDAHAVSWGLDGIRLLAVATGAQVMLRRSDRAEALSLLQGLARGLFALSSPTASGNAGGGGPRPPGVAR
ncbi:hypothetical protein [Catellatospora tritici]|uniref:hypothetical protein n=1 Tax=Catellatospora tritici TaxID=2851566 RepID=UPI001C2DE454|nr:hypothetical protein [Catellatospora tritici]MBV1856275.1 hypothetical protein [Catellatospora tritici]